MTAVAQRRARLTAPSPLKPGHDVASFNCDRVEMSIWLQKWAWKAAENNTAKTYAVCRGAKRVIAYFSLAAGAVSRDSAPGALHRNAPNPLPVIILARLAVDQTETGQGIGTSLVADAMRRSIRAAQIIGAHALLVHALDQKAAHIYQRLQFVPFAADAQTLYLPMNTLRDAL
jgi:GNAT superfamily N-acetyltransferase